VSTDENHSLGRLAALFDDLRNFRWAAPGQEANGYACTFGHPDGPGFAAFTSEVEAILGPGGDGTCWERCTRAFMALPDPARLALMDDLISALPPEIARTEVWPVTSRALATLPAASQAVFRTWVVGRPDGYAPVPAAAGPGDAGQALAPAAPSPEGMDDLLWLAAETPLAQWTTNIPNGRPHGPRFLWRAIEVAAIADSARSARDAGAWLASRLADRLAATILTEAEHAEAVAELQRRPLEDVRTALGLRLRTGCPPVLAREDARALSALLRVTREGTATSPDPEAGALDLAEVRAAIDALGEQRAMGLLPALAMIPDEPVTGLRTRDLVLEVVPAMCGADRARLDKRFRSHALHAIAAYGAAALADGETAEDRYLKLRWSLGQAKKFGSERQANHRRAVRAGLAHLAQVAGYPSADRMEWHIEARLADRDAAPDQAWEAAGYRVTLECAGADAVLLVRKGDRQLNSVPGSLRKEAAYKQAREAQERLRDQARRVRAGLVEPLVASGEMLPLDDFRGLLRIPAARAMLGEVILHTGDRRFGLLSAAEGDGRDPGGLEGLRLAGLDGSEFLLDGPVGAAHPWHLVAAGVLGGWQREVVRRHLRQPVRQAFRELYVQTPAERRTEVFTARFAGHRVTGRVAARLLAARGWRVRGSEDEVAAERACPGAGLHAVLHFEEAGHYLSEADAVTGTLRFRAPGGRAGDAVPLAEVDPLAFSEALRDIDLVVSVAHGGTGQRPYSVSTVEARAALAATLAGDLGLTQVTIDGHHARVQGTHAGYRVHLGSGSVHIEPGGHLCIVPDSAVSARSPIYLPFADEDQLTSLIISKILLLSSDATITAPTILRQIQQVVGSAG
jgi:hypothetical protein